jgi:protein gp37
VARIPARPKPNAIGWCEASANFWIGCTKVSPACDHCYAEALMARRAGVVEWGATGARVPTKHPLGNVLRWARWADHSGERARVFVNDIADTFDNHPTIRLEWREAVWSAVRAFRQLDFLLLTKRPQNVRRYLPADLVGAANLWLGITAENQAEFDRRWRVLADIPAVVRFVSAEPLLAPLILPDAVAPDWIIAGCESAGPRPGKRRTDDAWLRGLRDQCAERGISFWLKQREVAGALDKSGELDGVIHRGRPRPAS